jgi:carboxyl-terminal processing protease
MYVPEKNDAPEDFIRLLPPTRTYGEKDLDSTLVSSYAKDTDKPAYEVPFIVERKKPTAGDPPAVKPEDDEDEDESDEDEIVEDFEMRFAKEVVSSVNVASRPKLVAQAKKVVERVRSEEEKKLVAELSRLGVDWSAPVAEAGTANLEVSLQAPQNVKAGDVVSVTATVKNTGQGTAYRVLPRVHSDDNVFDDTELPVGKVAPGETKTFTAKLRVPKDSLDRKNRLSVEVKEARNAVARIIPTEVSIESAPRPVFAYAYQLIDEGNGDGLVQRGEKYRLQVALKNTGSGATSKATVLLRNATGDGVVLHNSRIELKDTPIQPGQVKDLEFKLQTDATLKSDELVVELMAYDADLDVQATEKLKFKVQPSIASARSSTEAVTVKNANLVIRSGASEDTSVVGQAPRGASYVSLGTFGPFTKVRLNTGGSRIGFLPTSGLATGGSGQGSFTPAWNSTPPVIAVNHKSLETSADTYKLNGQITDEQHVEDVYIFVSNQTAKIESRKVFYRSNRGGKDGKAMQFAADLPMWPGTNMVTVVARSNAQVRSVKTMYIYRDPTRTAQQTPPAAQPVATP